MGTRNLMQYKLNQIENEHGRIAKSIFVISTWIMETKRYESISRKFGNKDQLAYIWNHRNKAINEMLKTGLLEIKIHKPNDNRGLWLYVLQISRCGVDITLTIPYPLYQKRIGIHHSELEETESNEDMITIDNAAINYRSKKFTLGFAIENLDKSKVRLIEKMKEK